MKIACPTFCVAKLFRSDRFHRRILAGVTQAVRENIELVRAADSPDFRPVAEHVRHARDILELAYYRRDLRNVPDEIAQEMQRQDRLRRQRGEALVKCCPGDWRKKKIVHYCATCNTQEEAVQHVVKVLCEVAFNVVAAGSLVKWLGL